MNDTVMHEIGERLTKMTPADLQASIQSGYTLMNDIAAYTAQIRIAKALFDLQLDADKLLDYMLQYRPAHGIILFNNRQWYNKQVQEVNQYVANL